MFRLNNKKAQSAIEMCICIPIFMVCIFGAFDLTMVISGLMDTMVVARDSLREMSLEKASDAETIAKKGRQKAAALASRTQAEAPFLRFSFANTTTPSNSRGKINVQSGDGVHNSPQLVQICSDVQLMVPWMWGIRNGNTMKVCSTYYMIRQFQDK